MIITNSGAAVNTAQIGESDSVQTVGQEIVQTKQ